MDTLYEIRDSVAVMWLNTPNSKVNILDLETLKQIRNHVNRVKDNPLIKAIVLISAKNKNFIAGADINILAKFKSMEDIVRLSREAQGMATMVEKFPKPIVAAVNGGCVGGGVETILGTHYNIAINNKHTTFMLPEVLLGLLPGAGGTQRLPKKVPLPEALTMMITGAEITAVKAKEIGLIDQLVEPPDSTEDNDESELREKLLQTAIRIAKELADGTVHVQRTRDSILWRVYKYFFDVKVVSNMVLARTKAKIEKLSYGLYPAPLEIVEVLRATLGRQDDLGYDIESAGFAKLGMTKQHKALLGLFFGQTHCKKNHYGQPKPPTRNLAILGATSYGVEIAQISLLKDYHVTIKDTEERDLFIGLTKIKKKIAQKKIVGKGVDHCLSQLESTLQHERLKNAELVIECTSDNLSIKRQLLKECEDVMPDHCVYGINTWIIPVSHIADASNRKEMIVGMNYLNPVDKMKLVEIIKTEKTSNDALATAIGTALGQGKMVLVVKDRPGFFVTRVLTAVILETVRLIQEGVNPETLDTLAKKIGFVVGPVAIADGMGLDVVVRNAIYLETALGKRFTGGSTDLLLEMVANGMCGKKSNRGFFVYSTSKKTKIVNNTALEIVKNHKMEAGVKLTDDDIQYRLLLRFTNEAILCYQEGVIASPLEGDVGSVFGLGFPPCLGGPFRWADMYGSNLIVDKLRALQKVYGTSFTPCQALITKSRELDKKFHTYENFVITE